MEKSIVFLYIINKHLENVIEKNATYHSIKKLKEREILKICNRYWIVLNTNEKN